jgi:hypothetical protein
MEFNAFPAFEFEDGAEREMMTYLHAARGTKPIVQRCKQGEIGCETLYKERTVHDMIADIRIV